MPEIHLNKIYRVTDIQIHANKTHQNTLIEIIAQDGAHIGVLLPGSGIVELKGLIEKILSDNPDILIWDQPHIVH